MTSDLSSLSSRKLSLFQLKQPEAQLVQLEKKRRDKIKTEEIDHPTTQQGCVHQGSSFMSTSFTDY